MPDEKRKINCLIPASMYEKIEASEYKNITEAINAALENLMNDNSDEIKYYIDEIKEYNHTIEEYNQNRTALQAENVSLKEEAIQLRARSKELERHNDTLKKELEISQETHRNYMMQMQTLINQKAIEAHGVKRPWWRFW